MNVGGIGLDRPRDELIDQPNHRRLAGQVLQSFGIFLQRLSCARLRLVRLAVGRIQPLECCLQFNWHGYFKFDAPAAGRRNGGRREFVERISRREHQRPIFDSDRQGARLAQEARRQHVGEQRLGGRIARRCRHRQLEQGCIALRKTAFRQQAQLYQHGCPVAARSQRPRDRRARSSDRRTGPLAIEQSGKCVHRLFRPRSRLQMGLLARVVHGRYIVFRPSAARQMTPWRPAARIGDAIGLVRSSAAAPFVGSFLGVLIRRLPEGRPVAFARSRCEACGAALSVSRARAAGELYPAARSVPTLRRGDLAVSLDDRGSRGSGRHLGGSGGSGPGPSVARLAARLDIADAGLDRLSLHVASGCAHAAAAAGRAGFHFDGESGRRDDRTPQVREPDT